MLENRKSAVGESVLFRVFFLFFPLFSHLDGCHEGSFLWLPARSSSSPPPLSFLSINQKKLQSQWDGRISQAENSFTSKHFMKKLLLINHVNSHHDVKSLTNLSK